MINIQNFEAFLLASILLNMIPGSDTFYILGRSIAQGRHVGIASTLGVSAGALFHTMMAAIGLSAVVLASATVFLIVKLLGAAYLIYLGVSLFFTKEIDVVRPLTSSKAGFAKAFKEGLLTNMLNPKVAMFFIAFLPQFVAPSDSSSFLSFLLLGLTFVTTSTLWGLSLTLFSASLSKNLRQHPRYLHYLHKLAGTILVAIGIQLAVEKQ